MTKAREIFEASLKLDPLRTGSATSPIQAMPPGLSGLDRLKVQNLASNPQQRIAALQQMGFEVVPQPNGGLALRGPGQEDFGVLDPAGFDLGDFGDVLGDVATVVGAGAGGALGALGGTAVGGPAGGIGGGIVGGGAGATAVEALRQELAAQAGLPPPESPGAELLGAGAAGAAGGVLGPVAGKVTGAALKASPLRLLASGAQRGGRFLQEVAPRVGGVAASRAAARAGIGPLGRAAAFGLGRGATRRGISATGRKVNPKALASEAAAQGGRPAGFQTFRRTPALTEQTAEAVTPAGVKRALQGANDNVGRIGRPLARSAQSLGAVAERVGGALKAKIDRTTEALLGGDLAGYKAGVMTLLSDPIFRQQFRKVFGGKDNDGE